VGNRVVQWQIVARDADGEASFYLRLFGWTLDADNAFGYRQLHGGGIDGGVWPAPPEAPSFVQLIIEVDDVDAHIEKASALGARVIVPKSVLPDGDVMAILADPAGITFGITALARRESPPSPRS
jgi:predicted enzyme related to lactoylglutathione lyase